MDLAEKYIYEVYQQKGFSKAAQKLYISQSALSITVKKAEQKLGFQIFDRTKTPIALTREGQIYVDYLEEIIADENNMYNRIQALTKPINEQISVGNAFFISRYLLPPAVKAFQQAYPDNELKLHMCESSRYSTLFEKLDAGTVDFVIGFEHDENSYSSIPLFTDRYVICIKKDYPGVEKLQKYALTYDEIMSKKPFSHKRISDYSLFADIEFLKINSVSILWRDMAKFLMHCPISPCQIYSCRNIDVAYDMMLQGLGAAIITDSVISYRPPTEDVLYFLVKTDTPTRQTMIIHRKDVPLSRGAEAFIEILQKTCEAL